MTIVMSTENKFLDFAETNFALLKVHKGAKNPVGDGWQDLWSKDRADWEKWRAEGFNSGVHAGASRLIIFDLDSKHGGIAAVRKRFDDWCATHNMAPLPHHVETPSKGQHVYMLVREGVDPMTLATNLNGKIGAGIDVLTGNHQSVAPGSYFDGSADGKPSGFYTFNSAADIYPAPQSVIDFCTRKPRKEGVSKVGEHDFEQTLKCYRWMADNGAVDKDVDWRTCGMAARLEYGERGLELWEALATRQGSLDYKALRRWESFDTEPTPGCSTLKSVFDIAHKAGWTGSVPLSVTAMFNGCAAQAAIDAAKAAGTYAPSIVPDQGPQQLISAGTPVPGGPNVAPSEPREYAPAVGLMKRLGDWMAEFTELDFLWEDILLRKYIYSLTAATGTGKTAIAMLLAASVALGEKLCGKDVEQGTVVYLAGENPTDVQMRFHGQCQVLEVCPHKLDIHVIPSTFEFKDCELVRAECEANNLKPSIVIVDTLAAYFPGEDDNHNVQMGNYIRTLRTLCTLPGEPCVLVLCHPVKGAKTIDEMVPRGGSAAINEFDGNLGAAVGPDGLIAVQRVVKFRGAPFDPLYFKTWVVNDNPNLKTTKGKQLKTVVAREVTDQGAAAMEKAAETDDIRLLRDIDAHPGDDLRKRGARLGCHASTVKRRIDGLAGPKRKLVDNSGVIVKLTAKGQKELNALETAEKDVQQSATSTVPFPLPSGA